MSKIYYKYTSSSTGKDIEINNVNYTAKLIVLNSDYNTEGGVVDSSEIFFNRNINTDNKGNLAIDLDRDMNTSKIFRTFWAKWSRRCGEIGHGEPPTSTFYFGLQISQTFKGDANYAGFSYTNNIFVPSFENRGFTKDGISCSPKTCEPYYFNFWDIDAEKQSVKNLVFNQEQITEKQVKAAQTKIDYEVQLKNYQSQLIAQSSELILSTYDYQPDSFTKVITRLLEFQQGTLVTSLDFARNADLTQLYSLLGPVNGIDYEINSLTGLYPSIDIEDGEGIPYGDGIPALYEYFGWNFDGDDFFAVVNNDGSSVSNYGIITRNNVEIFDTRDFSPSLDGYESFRPSDYISWGNFNYGDIIECTITLTDYTEDDTNFTKSNFGFELDSISSGVTIASNPALGFIYNSLVESSWDADVSPSGTTWNSQFTDSGNYGWSNLSNVSSRNFGTLIQALDSDIGRNTVGLELVMYDETTDEYWAVKFTNLERPNDGGGFEYIRKLIVPAGTVKTFKDTLVWK
jgi:hypothetical protein